MRLHFLHTSVPLTKTYEMGKDGKLIKTPYPNVFRVTSTEENVPTIADLAPLLATHAAAGACLLKGQLSRALTDESRAGTTDSNATTYFLCLDFDAVPDTYLDLSVTPPKTVKVTPDYLLEQIGIPDTSYVLQWSASYRIADTNTVRMHIFIMLSAPIPAPVIKQWLIQVNHTVPVLQAAQTLTKTGNSLHWGLDITACQNDKLIYIAPPVLKNLKDPLKAQPRITFVRKKHATFTFPQTINPASVNLKATTDRINALREAAGLPARRFTYKVVSGVDTLVKPERCTITDTRTERGFVYFNLNGGDSWAYYHPEDHPDVIYNFKGEPNYSTKELLPEYWASLTSQASRTTSAGLSYLVFLDRKSSTYYRGTYDSTTDHLDITPAKNETQVRHFAEQFGVPLGSYIPEWDLTFNPNDSVRVDFANRSINTFQPTEYMKATAKQVTRCPPTIFRVVHHALGSDTEATEHFINWLAFIVQNRARTRTAWVLHGTEGTGKGIMMQRILRPILGSSQTAIRRMEELNEPYNAYMRQCFLVFVDEIEAKALLNERGVMAKLRSFIAEPTVTIRQMYSSAIEWDNYTNWIFASNKSEPVLIPKDDRRFNVGKYQPNKLGMNDAELDKIPKELQAFHDYLLGFPVDKAAASTPLDNDDRNTMIAISENSIDSVAAALIEGNMEFLLDQLPANNAYHGDGASQTKIANYKHALQSIMARTDLTNGRANISRDELQVIFTYIVGKTIPDSPHKFTSLLKHYRITTVKVRCDDKSVYGMKVTFKDVKAFGLYAATYFPQPPAPPPKAAKKAA